MHWTSSLYDRLYHGDYDVEYKLIIAGVEYGMGEIVSLRRSNSLFSEFGIGNSNSGQIDLQLRPKGEIPRQAQIEIFKRIVHGRDASEWLPSGVYFFSNRRTDLISGVMSVTGFDAMLKTEGTFLDGKFEDYSWPMPAVDAAVHIADRVGGVIDERSDINVDYRIPCPIQVDEKGNESGSFPTMREIMTRIAIASAGNWTVTDEGRLLLVGIASQPAPSSYLVTEKGAPILFGGTRILVGDTPPGAWYGGMGETYVGTRVNELFPRLVQKPVTGIRLVRTDNEADENADQSMVVYIANSGRRYHSRPDCGVGGYHAVTLGEALERNKTPCQHCSGNTYHAGDDSGYVLECECEDATQAMADYILSRVDGYIYRPYEGTDAILNPAAELGDGIYIGGVYSVLATLDISLDALHAGNISAPASDGDEDEYPYIPKSERDLRRVEDKVEELEEEVEELEEEIDDIVDALDHDGDGDPIDDIEEIFDRLDELENKTGEGGCECKCEHPRTDEIDFTRWDEDEDVGYFREVLDTGEEVIYKVDKDVDEDGKPKKITNIGDGHECLVRWPDEV